MRVRTLFAELIFFWCSSSFVTLRFCDGDGQPKNSACVLELTGKQNCAMAQNITTEANGTVILTVTWGDAGAGGGSGGGGGRFVTIANSSDDAGAGAGALSRSGAGAQDKDKPSVLLQVKLNVNDANIKTALVDADLHAEDICIENAERVVGAIGKLLKKLARRLHPSTMKRVVCLLNSMTVIQDAVDDQGVEDSKQALLGYALLLERPLKTPKIPRNQSTLNATRMPMKTEAARLVWLLGFELDADIAGRSKPAHARADLGKGDKQQVDHDSISKSLFSHALSTPSSPRVSPRASPSGGSSKKKGFIALSSSDGCVHLIFDEDHLDELTSALALGPALTCKFETLEEAKVWLKGQIAVAGGRRATRVVGGGTVASMDKDSKMMEMMQTMSTTLLAVAQRLETRQYPSDGSDARGGAAAAGGSGTGDAPVRPHHTEYDDFGVGVDKWDEAEFRIQLRHRDRAVRTESKAIVRSVKQEAQLAMLRRIAMNPEGTRPEEMEFGDYLSVFAERNLKTTKRSLEAKGKVIRDEKGMIKRLGGTPPWGYLLGFFSNDKKEWVAIRIETEREGVLQFTTSILQSMGVEKLREGLCLEGLDELQSDLPRKQLRVLKGFRKDIAAFWAPKFRPTIGGVGGAGGTKVRAAEHAIRVLMLALAFLEYSFYNNSVPLGFQLGATLKAAYRLDFLDELVAQLIVSKSNEYRRNLKKMQQAGSGLPCDKCGLRTHITRKCVHADLLA